MTWLIAFCAAFVFIFLKAFQQLNVMHKQYLLVLPTSMLMAACEVYVIATTARNGYGWIVLAIGLGSGLGAMASMWLHSRITK
ncbi:MULTISPECIES: hypothetical protein [Massilia]|uniref:hypothetical protein n=1 Tax=Massilia TaxID=149698 RepID=UPI00226D4BA1|nr:MULTISPECIES: hypothetical protein [unclassified Massilia]MCY0910862.1 hypothetical protein [Massilia sp. H27-R4]MDQ1921652.1 hypothetical protein [Massilia sp. CCM 9206]